jgi:regulator of protease activity HflC (stomatin/prohibitin superfamily)
MGTLGGVLLAVLIPLLFVFFLLGAAVRIVQEYERGVIFRLGRLVGAKGPGLFFLIPIIDRMAKVDLRVVALDVPSQECITRDNVTVTVTAVAYYRVIDPQLAIVAVEDFQRATWQIAQTSLRNVIGQSELDELLAHREKINEQLQNIIDVQTEPWGVKVSIVEVKDVELPQTMQRSMAGQAEAEREKRAKIIAADGEYQASKQLAAAAAVIASQPAALQLRYLQTLAEIAGEQNSTVVFPVPIEFLRGLIPPVRSQAEGAPPQEPSET